MRAGLWTVFAVALVAALIVVGPAYAAEQVTLPAAATEAVKKAYPDATLGQVTMRDEAGVKLYEVSLSQKDTKMAVTVAEDGMIVNTKTEVAKTALPEAVGKAVEEAAKDGTVGQIDKIETVAAVKDGKLMKLDAPAVSYAVAITKDSKVSVVTIAENGTVTGTEERAEREKAKEAEKPAEKPAEEPAEKPAE